MKKILLTLITILLSEMSAFSQSSDFVGTFVNGSNTISIQFKRVGDEYHGMLAAVGASFAIRATGSFGNITGEIYGLEGPTDFEATLNGTEMKVRATGYNEPFYKYSDLHNLGSFDLTPYMKSNRSITENNALQPIGQPTQYNTEEYPKLNNEALFNMVAGSQLVFYQRGSSANNNIASSITYVNFCPNGTFALNTDGSYSVEGDYGETVYGASYANNSGTWQLVSYQGQPALYLQYYNGDTSINPFKENELRQGRWRRAKTQYALQRNKVRCN